MKRFMMVCASVVMLSCLASAQEKKDLSARIQSSLEQVRSSMSDGKGVRNGNLEECKISGYDCKEVVDLFYEIFMEEDEAGEPRFSTEQQELVIVEPYAAQLTEMKIVIVRIDLDRGGGMRIGLEDGTEVALPLKDKPSSVTFPDGDFFAFPPKKAAPELEGPLPQYLHTVTPPEVK